MDRESEITRWADGTLSGDELARFEAAMAADPALRAEAEAARDIHQILQDGLPSETAVPDAAAFNSGVLEAIEAGKVAPFPGQAAQPSKLPWLVSAAACAAAAFALLSRPAPGDTGPRGTYAYTPDPSVDARVYVDEDAGATVIMLEGVGEIPAGHQIAPKTLISRAIPGGAGNRAFIAKNHGTTPVMVLTRSAGGQVHIQDVH